MGNIVKSKNHCLLMRICPAALILFSIAANQLCAGDAPTQLAKDGRALLKVVVSPQATPRVRQAAETLAGYLLKISGAKFQIVTGNGKTGLAVGLARHFPELPKRLVRKQDDPTSRENYLLASHKTGVYLIGATDLAVEHAVWDLLYHVGYRQFFPGKNWEVIPKTPNLAITVNSKESPDYFSRRIWYGFGPWDYARKPYEEWCAKNRATSGVALSTGHSYSGIIRSNQAEFDAHPEYYALVKGKRQTNNLAQLCIGNPDLRRLVVAHALRVFSKKTEADSISMDPNDGGGWCECERCRKLGSVSDRVLTLANDVAAAANNKHGNKFVGIYAYNYHSPPPSIRVHPKVVVSVATAFIRGGFQLEELITGWSKQGATLGIREYYSVNTWDRDLPGQARGSNLDYLTRTIPEFHGKGARFMSAESSDNWGCNGLGYYLAARMLWDTAEAKRTDDLIDDFLSRAFGNAKKPMWEFYQLLDGSREHLDFDDRLGRMFRCLEKAKKVAKSPNVSARINDLVLYARYVDLYDRYAKAKGPQRQAAFEALIRHTYRMRKTMMVHAKAIYRDIHRRDRSVTIPPTAQWHVSESKNPWKSSKLFSEAELRGYLSEGIRKRQLVKLNFKPVDFSAKLVPAAKLKLPDVKPGVYGRGRGKRTFYTWVANAPATIELKITGGLIAHYRDRGNVRVDLWRLGEKAIHIARDRSVPPDGKERTVRLRAAKTGLHKITLSDGGDLTHVSWPPGMPMTCKSSRDEPIRSSGRWSLYFYVPKKTRTIGLFAAGAGTVLDSRGQKACSFDKGKPSYYTVPVPKDQQGALWKIHQAAGAVRLLNVPPYLARSKDELLLPAEVVGRDLENK